MHGQQRARARCDGSLDACRVDIVGRGIGLYRHRRGPDARDSEPGGDIGIGGHDHLIPGADIQGPERQRQRIEPVGHANRMSRLAIGRPFRLERLDLGAEDVPATVEHPGHGGVNPRLEFEIGGAEIEEGDHEFVVSCTAARNTS